MVAKCAPGEKKKQDCNTCTCGEDGQFWCTTMACVDAAAPEPAESGVAVDASPPLPTETGMVDPGAPGGCPPKPPASGHACGPISFYCYYFDTESDSCPDAFKCTGGAFYAAGENCKVPIALCKGGTMCGPNETCVVTCNRTCTCAMGVVSCAPSPC